jgi:outer membrane protein assembly factor BamC
VTVFPRFPSLATLRLKPLSRCVAVALATQLVGCSAISDFVGGDKIDYRTTGGKKGPGLEVPPDLTQLARDPRYQPQSGTVSASTFQTAPAATVTGSAAASILGTPALVAPAAVGELAIERSGNQRWLSTSLPPEKLWPQLQAFWTERGFNLVTDQAEVGVMETEWAENRAKLPQDIIRQTIGRVFDSLYSTGERDKFRTRVERTAKGTEVYISHRGLVEVYSSTQKDSTMWQPRPADPQLEAEFLQRLMIKLGAKDETAKAAAAQAPVQAQRARVIEGAAAASLQMDDGFDRAWRRVGLSLDRAGFTVEDRDRSQGIYFVRYVDPAHDKKEEPGFFSRIFSFGKSDEASNLARYRVSLKSEGESTTVSVLSAQGANNTGDVGKRIVNLLVDDLK